MQNCKMGAGYLPYDSLLSAQMHTQHGGSMQSSDELHEHAIISHLSLVQCITVLHEDRLGLPVAVSMAVGQAE